MKHFTASLVMASIAVSAYAGPATVALAALSPTFAAFSPEPAPAAFFEAKAPALEITKTCPSLRYVGRDATFEITVTNRGNAAANNVVVTDVIAGSDFLSADNNGVREGDRVVWRIGTMEAGDSRTLKITTRCSRIGQVKNTATVAYCAEAMASCEFPVKGIPAILLECVDEPDPIEVGGTLTYTIEVTNQGSETGTNIKITCTLPPEQEFVQAGGATAGRGEGKTVTFEPLASLAPKAKAAFTVKVRGIRAGDSRFKVSMNSDQLTSPVEETESTHIYD